MISTSSNKPVFKNIKKEFRLNWDKYLMILPFLLLFTVFTITPVLSSMALSFTDFNLLQLPKFVGLDNYVKLILEDDIFLISVKNTIVFGLVTGPVSYFGCLIMAWLINEMNRKLRTVLTLLFYAPSISGGLYMIWTLLFGGDMYSWGNGFLMNMGIIHEPVQWLTDPKYNLIIVIIVQLWMSFGAGFLSFIAGLQSIDRSLYEASAMDGIKNRWQELIYVTLPSMGPQLLFGAILQISASFSVGRLSMDLTGFPSTDYSTSTVITHAIDYGTLRYEMGYASSIAVLLFLSMILFNVYVRRILRKYI